VQSGAVLKLGILARGLQGVVAVPAVALGAEFLLPARGAEGADAATAPFVFGAIVTQRFDKYLPTAHGARPLSTLSQRTVYRLWRADLIRALEAHAKATSSAQDWEIAISARRRLPVSK
jgi:hypothetical protein